MAASSPWEVLKDWRVALMVVLVLASIASIYLVPWTPEAGITGNLQLGLDLEGGSWIQLGFKSEVVGFTSGRQAADFLTELQEKLDTEIILLDNGKIEIRKYYTKDELTAIFSELGGTLVTYDVGVGPETAADIKKILEEKINSLGTRDAKVNTITSLNGVTQFIRIELAGTDIATAQDIVSKQGKFEIRIQTSANQSEHVLFGDAITSVQTPSRDAYDSWAVPFTLSESGAEAFRDACIEYNAVNDVASHHLWMFLDDQMVYDAPLDSSLATELKSRPIRSLQASTGTGDEGKEQAKVLEIHLRAGALPVEVEIAGSGSVPAAMGEYFKMVCIFAGLLALIAVAAMVYWRYREPSIVLPMVGTNIAEIIILLGIARFIQQLDLASIAGIIAVLGTGIDQLVVITDEVLFEGKVPSPNLYLKRLSRALRIIVIAASTTFIAMVPLAVMSLSTLKGFAIVTILGVLIGVIVTRPAYGRIIMSILSR